MEKKLVYFAHPLTHYNTEMELKCERRIRDNFNYVEIFNPNQKWLQRVYNNRKKNGHKKPFDIFEELSEACDITVGVTFIDGVLGAGVAKECTRAYTTGKEVFILFPSTMEMIGFNARLPSLSIEETRERIKRKEL
jgi:hypothetical protein